MVNMHENIVGLDSIFLCIPPWKASGHIDTLMTL